MKRTGIKRMCLLAGAVVLGSVANAFFYDATITIDRAINSPTLTVRYSGANATMVELRINGVSIGTRSVNGLKSFGETNFKIDSSMLTEGDNTVEVRLFNKDGKLVGTERSIITADSASQGPVFLSVPKVGATLQGPVAIKLGFGKQMKNVYVSFFIDNQFKSMLNTPPFEYIWDTTKEPNGWHELEAWVLDGSSTTFKTPKVKVFVNNPSGQTQREDSPATVPSEVKKTQPKTVETKTVEIATMGNKTGKTLVVGGEAGLRPNAKVGSPTVAASAGGAIKPKAALTSNNPIAVAVGSPSGLKNTVVPPSITMGPKHMTPTGTRVAYSSPAASTVAVKNVASATRMVQITRGQKLPNLPTYSILLNSKFVEFDVNPRVENGVPLTPFRHLIQQAGGEVNWTHASKTVDAKAEGRTIWIKIGDKLAKVNNLPVDLELAPFIENGRTIVPLSFIKESLNVDVEYDPETGHVLITTKK